jgi:dTDP-4-amino-4,6-dideoxy-D-galactose acyltransferase
MIEELRWDTQLFGRKMGTIKKLPSSQGNLKKAIKEAKKNGFQYLLCKLKCEDWKAVGMLQKAGFYLSDIGVIWETDTYQVSMRTPHVCIAMEKDINALKKMTKRLFRYSRFYHDPFFTKRDADCLFEAWVENSVKGKEADIVFWIRGVGFITCRKVSSAKGMIPLIGVVDRMRGKGFGKILILTAIKWFKKKGIKRVQTRSQLTNIQAANFYSRIGFKVIRADIVLSKII